MAQDQDLALIAGEPAERGRQIEEFGAGSGVAGARAEQLDGACHLGIGAAAGTEVRDSLDQGLARPDASMVIGDAMFGDAVEPGEERPLARVFADRLHSGGEDLGGDVFGGGAADAGAGVAVDRSVVALVDGDPGGGVALGGALCEGRIRTLAGRRERPGRVAGRVQEMFARLPVPGLRGGPPVGARSRRSDNPALTVGGKDPFPLGPNLKTFRRHGGLAFRGHLST